MRGMKSSVERCCHETMMQTAVPGADGRIRCRKRDSGFREACLVSKQDEEELRKGQTCCWESKGVSHFQTLKLARFPKSEMASQSRLNLG